MEDIVPKTVAAIQTNTEDAMMGSTHIPVDFVVVKELHPPSQEAEHWIIKANRIINMKSRTHLFGKKALSESSLRTLLPIKKFCSQVKSVS